MAHSLTSFVTVSSGGEVRVPRSHLDNLELLNSNYWNQRSTALDELKKLTDSNEIYVLFKEIETRNDDNLRFHFIVVLEHFLLSTNYKVCGIALLCLIYWKDKGSSALNLKASHSIQDYIHSSKVLRYLKIKSIRYAWEKMPGSKQEALLDIVSRNHLKELSNIVLSSFSIKNEKLWLKAIHTLIKFKERRGNRYIKRILQHHDNNTKLIESSLKAIGILGSFYDFKIVTKYINDPNIKIQIQALRAYFRLVGFFAVSRMSKLFSSTANDKIKLEILSQLGKLNHKNSCKFLIKLLLEEHKGDVGIHVDWALHECDNRIKIPLLIKTFNKSTNQKKVTILNFLNDISDNRLEPFIFENISNNDNELVKLMTFSLSSGYPSERIIAVLEEDALQFEGLISYTALLELYNINKLENPIILKRFFETKKPLENLCHLVILKRLSENNVDESVEQYIDDYLLEAMSKGNTEIKMLAIDSCTRRPSEKIVDLILHESRFNKSDVLKESCETALINIVINKPRFLSKVPHLLIDERTIIKFSHIKLSSEFYSVLSSYLREGKISIDECFLNATKYNVETHQLDLFSTVEDVNLFLSFWFLYELDMNIETMGYVISKQYSYLSEENKVRFLEYLSYSSEIKYIDFFYKETLERMDTLSHLISPYIENVKVVR